MAFPFRPKSTSYFRQCRLWNLLFGLQRSFFGFHRSRFWDELLEQPRVGFRRSETKKIPTSHLHFKRILLLDVPGFRIVFVVAYFLERRCITALLGRHDVAVVQPLVIVFSFGAFGNSKVWMGCFLFGFGSFIGHAWCGLAFVGSPNQRVVVCVDSSCILRAQRFFGVSSLAPISIPLEFQLQSRYF